MAKERMINTRFWIDDYVSHLDPVEKLLFLYFLTNPFTDISGVYEIPIKNIALDTGIDKDMVEKIVKRFEFDGKIFYKDGWVAIKNFPKHQNQNNPKILKGIEIGLSKAPKSLIDKLSITYQDLSHLNSNSNLNSNNTTVVVESTLFDSKAYFNEMLDSDKVVNKIIACFVIKKGLVDKITNKQQAGHLFKRYVKVANRLKDFEEEKVVDAMNTCDKTLIKGEKLNWTLETVEKQLLK